MAFCRALDGEVVHLPFRIALREVIHRGDALVRIALRLLKFLDRLADLAGLEIQHAHFEADGQVGGKFFHALLAFRDLEIELSRRSAAATFSA